MREPQKLRIAYLSGPCNAPAVFAEWTEQKQQEFYGTDYVKQFLQVSTDLNAESYVITTLPGSYSKCRRGSFIFENRPKPLALKGALYHAAMVVWFLRVIPKLLYFRPHVMIVTDNFYHWFMLFPLRWFGVFILPSFHSVLWPKCGHVKVSFRLCWQLNRWLIMRHLKAVLHTSNDIARQVRDLLGATIDQIDVVGHLPTYFDKSQFASIPLPTSAPRPPFRVFFIGRIETNKGVYDLVEMARRLDSQRKGAFHFDICGDGGELGNLRKQVCDLNLQDVVSCHGFCSSKVVSSLLGASHTVIVPTRSSYEAGFEMTCAEAILANRPLIASPVCPALEYVRGAAVEVEPDNVDQYCEAILKLCDDEQYYTRKVLACADLQKQFYDVKNSWGIKLKEILAKYILNETATSAPADANYTL